MFRGRGLCQLLSTTTQIQAKQTAAQSQHQTLVACLKHYPNSINGFFINDGNIRPAKLFNNFHHG